MLSFSDVVRTIAGVQWNGGDRHVFIAEQVGGKTIFLELQTEKACVE